MHVTLTQSLGAINDLFDYLESIEQTNALIQYTPIPTDSPTLNLLSGNINNILTRFRSKKVFEYNSVIISAYGILENFLENVVLQYLDVLTALCHSYKSLPTEIIDNHFDLSAQLIKNLDKPKYAGKISKEIIITNLHSCIINKKYKINSLAYIHHTSNFRHDTVVTLMKQIGVKDLTNKLLNCNLFTSHIQSRYQTKNLAALRSEKIFSILDELAQRRNDVSHGVNGNIISRAYQQDFLEYIKAYIQSIYFILKQELYLIAQSHLSKIKIIDIKHCFKKHIICFGHAQGTLAIGDAVMVQPNVSYPERRLSTVNRIQVCRNDYDIIDWDKQVDICMELDKLVNVTTQYQFHTITPEAHKVLKSL
jgi:hypothetical protein